MDARQAKVWRLVESARNFLVKAQQVELDIELDRLDIHDEFSCGHSGHTDPLARRLETAIEVLEEVL